MTTMQPRTPEEAAQLGLLMPNVPRGIFGSGRRRLTGYTPGRDGTGASGGVGMSPPLDPASAPGMQPPSIDQAPPPPADWKNTLGPELMAQLPQMLAQSGGRTRIANGDTTQPLETSPMSAAPPMRAIRGIFGSTPSDAMPQLASDSLPMLSDKIANRGAPMPDANGMGKKGFDWRMLAGIIGDGLLGAAGQPGVYGPAMFKRRQDEMNHAQRLAEMREQARIKAAEPDYATVNNRRVRIDPTTGQADVLYQAPQDFEDYAASLGAEPGSPEYDRLVQDYVLRSAGPTATDFNLQEEENRQDNRVSLEGVRQGNRQSLLGQRQAGQRALKGVPTYRQANPAPRSGGRPGSGSKPPSLADIPEGATGRDANGVRYVKRGGKLVPLK